jgi:hypothetical protein
MHSFAATTCIIVAPLPRDACIIVEVRPTSLPMRPAARTFVARRRADE